jgi:hypothetical protein
MGPYFQKAQYNPWSEPVPTAGSGALVEGVVVVLPNLQDKSVSNSLRLLANLFQGPKQWFMFHSIKNSLDFCHRILLHAEKGSLNSSCTIHFPRLHSFHVG